MSKSTEKLIKELTYRVDDLERKVEELGSKPKAKQTKTAKKTKETKEN